MGKLNFHRIGYHVIFWLAYLPLNATITNLVSGASVYENLQNAMRGELSTLPVKMAVVYFIFYVILPRFLQQRKAVWLGMSIFFTLIIGSLLYRAFDGYVYLPLFEPELAGRIPVFSFENFILALFDLFVSSTPAVAIKLIRTQFKSMEYQQQLIQEKLQSELDFLRAQTNPHFLFNTLNNLYGLARKKSDKAPDAIMMLSKILRFMLYDCRAHRIPVTNEAKVIRDYIELEKLRYNDRLKIDYEEDLDAPNALIAPLLLLPFVENSFKHGAHSSTDNASIQIKLTVKNNVLDFSVHNTFDESKSNGHAKNGNGQANIGGIGMSNEKRQLDLIYPNRHALDIGEEEGWYRANLHIELGENTIENHFVLPGMN
jgi:two-component system, LytTR family, sensor kinase